MDFVITEREQASSFLLRESAHNKASLPNKLYQQKKLEKRLESITDFSQSLDLYMYTHN